MGGEEREEEGGCGGVEARKWRFVSRYTSRAPRLRALAAKLAFSRSAPTHVRARATRRGPWAPPRREKCCAVCARKRWARALSHARGLSVPAPTLRPRAAVAHAGGGEEAARLRPRPLRANQGDILANICGIFRERNGYFRARDAAGRARGGGRRDARAQRWGSAAPTRLEYIIIWPAAASWERRRAQGALAALFPPAGFLSSRAPPKKRCCGRFVKNPPTPRLLRRPLRETSLPPVETARRPRLPASLRRHGTPAPKPEPQPVRLRVRSSSSQRRHARPRTWCGHALTSTRALPSCPGVDCARLVAGAWPALPARCSTTGSNSSSSSRRRISRRTRRWRSSTSFGRSRCGRSSR